MPFNPEIFREYDIRGVAGRDFDTDFARQLVTQAGFFLLIALMIFVVVLDLSRCAGTSPALF